jgi:hypothetical protein
MILEPLIPDLRFEYPYKNDQTDQDNGFDKKNLVLSWPIHLPVYESSGYSFTTTLFVEPQYKLDNKNSRLLAGSRLIFEVLNDNLFLFEAGAIKDNQEGNGGFGSLGFGWEVDDEFNFAIVCRNTITQKEMRIDISFDFWTDIPFSYDK